jgi:drug/metabolite transporter (DMT)-like permease
MVTVNRSLPSVTTSLGLLATPVMGVATSAIFLGEPISTSLICAMAMILGGIAIGTLPSREDAFSREDASSRESAADRPSPQPDVVRV